MFWAWGLVIYQEFHVIVSTESWEALCHEMIRGIYVRAWEFNLKIKIIENSIKNNNEEEYTMQD